MKSLLKFEHFRLIREAEENIEAFLDNIYESSLNENIGAALGSPVKFTKLKNNAKAYQKALVAKAINNLDFEKKKAAGIQDPKQKEVLAAANKQKNQALQDEVSAISQRMDQLATTTGLKAVSSMAKNKSALAAAQISAKVADGEEAKALKLKIQGLNKKIKDSQEELEDYTKDDKDSTQDTSNVKSDSDDKNVKAEAEAKAKETADKEAEAEAKAKETADKEAEAEAKAKETAEPDPINKEIADIEDRIKTINNKAKDKNSPLANPKVLAAAIKQEEEDLQKLKDKQANPQESNQYIEESVSDKFRYLMNKNIK